MQLNCLFIKLLFVCVTHLVSAEGCFLLISFRLCYWLHKWADAHILQLVLFFFSFFTNAIWLHESFIALLRFYHSNGTKMLCIHTLKEVAKALWCYHDFIVLWFSRGLLFYDSSFRDFWAFINKLETMSNSVHFNVFVHSFIYLHSIGWVHCCCFGHVA